jgi:uncharacterized protein YjbI with pentapeptide repeats
LIASCYLPHTPHIPELRNPPASLSPALELLNFADRLEKLLDLASPYKRDDLRDLSCWLVCCKNLWPDSEPAAALESTPPFRLNEPRQFLRVDPAAVERTLHTILSDQANEFLSGEILACVDASNDVDWQALRNPSYSASLIDPADAPCNWPKECLIWAIRSMDMEGADLRDADLRHANLPGVCFKQTDLTDADLSYSTLCEATFDRSNLTGAKLTATGLNHSMLVSTLFFKAELAGVHLYDATIEQCNFQWADLREGKLMRASIRFCDMRNAMLDHADMSWTYLPGTKLKDASLNHTNFSFSDLTGAVLTATDGNLNGANFRGAEIADFGLDIGPLDLASDGFFALRKGLLPRELDHIVRDNLLQVMAQDDSDEEGDYLASYTDDDSDSETGSCIDSDSAGASAEVVDASSLPSRWPNWQTTLCSLLLLSPYQYFSR